MTFIPLLYRWTVDSPPGNCCRVRGTRWYTYVFGIDFLSTNKVLIDTAIGTLRSPNFEVKLFQDKPLSEMCFRVHVKEIVHLPPNWEISVQGVIRWHFLKDQEGCLEPLDEFRGSNA
jgi:hypothetical protein